MSERPLPARRRTTRHKVQIGGHKIYVDVGVYNDGRPGELFIVVDQTGSEVRWFYDEIARLASKLMQYGCPLEEIAAGWVGTRGKIAGPVQGDLHIKFCTSVLDYVGRSLAVDYCGRTELAHVLETTST